MTSPGPEDPYRFLMPFYDEWAAHMTDDIDMYVRYALAAADPVIELGAGTGRVAIPIAAAGRRVIGVEPSDAMRVEGIRRAAEAGVSDLLTFVPGDMRTWVSPAQVELVIIPFRAFMHLLTTEDQQAALACIRASLVPGGRLVFNVFTVDPEVVVHYQGVPRLQATFTDEAGRACEAWATARYMSGDQRLDVAIDLRVRQGERTLGEATETMRLRTIGRYEAQHLMERAGFAIEALYGDFNGGPYGPGPDEMIWIARRDDG